MISDDWQTPQWLYDSLNDKFHFNFDPCPYPRKDGYDCLKISWFGNVFINPPFSDIERFLLKGLLEFYSGNSKLLVYLLPTWSDTSWFHNLIIGYGFEIRYIRDRFSFENDIIKDRPAKMCNFIAIKRHKI